MGYDFNKDPKYHSEKYVSIKIELTKKCYMPGEFITGLITLSPKPGITETNFNNPSINFTISQYQYILLGEDSLIKQNDDILIQPILFSNYMGANLLTELNIPFSIQVPKDIMPTILFNENMYCKHFLTININSIEAKKTVLIIIKNDQNFTIGNKLLKSPATIFKEIDKKSFLVNKGKIICFLKIPKNSFYFNEQIPIELTLNCSEIDLIINGIEISIIREQKIYSLNTNFNTVAYEDSKIIFSQEYSLEKNQELYIFKQKIQFPTSSEYTSVFPPTVYSLIELHDQNTLFDDLKYYILCPSAQGRFFSVKYFLNVKILFDNLFTFNEDLKIPIDFYSPPIEEEKNIIDYPTENELKFQNINNISSNNSTYRSSNSDCSAPPVPGSKRNFININDLGDYSELSSQRKNDKNNLKDVTDMSFEVIDEKDFYNVLTKKNNKEEKSG